MWWVAVGALIAVGTSMTLASPAQAPAARARAERVSAPTLRFDIVATYRHDPDAFTQGLLYRDGFLYESTGRNGQSSLRKVRLETGEVVQRRTVEARYFAEGLVDWRNRLIQLTWNTNVAFVYDLTTFTLQSTFAYPGEGWGLTHDGKRLIMSDGTPSLRWLDPETFKEQGRLRVTDGGAPVDDLNELEFINGRIYANVWLTDRIAVIDPANGHVVSWLDLAALRPRSIDNPDAVLNGIAYDAAGGRLFVTGKLWPQLFHIRLRAK
jgi:glutamine cyclotransferase